MLHGRRCSLVSALTTLFFTIIPVVRIIYGPFPFNPNRWFGIGLLTHYCCISPMLYQVRQLSLLASCTQAKHWRRLPFT